MKSTVTKLISVLIVIAVLAVNRCLLASPRTQVTLAPWESSCILVSAHSHNDYLRKRPLYDAVASGITSVEADVRLIDGQLLVAHTLADTRSDRTLASLYLIPLQSMDHHMQLVVDIKDKEDPTSTFLAVVDELKKYPSDINVVFTGYHVDLRAPRPANVTFNWFYSNEALSAPADAVGSISVKWVTGMDITNMAREAHARGKVFNVWGPNDAHLWANLTAQGADTVSTDFPYDFRIWLNHQGE